MYPSISSALLPGLNLHYSGHSKLLKSAGEKSTCCPVVRLRLHKGDGRNGEGMEGRGASRWGMEGRH